MRKALCGSAKCDQSKIDTSLPDYALPAGRLQTLQFAMLPAFFTLQFAIKYSYRRPSIPYKTSKLRHLSRSITSGTQIANSPASRILFASRSSFMMDVVFILATIGFFAACVAYVYAFERI
jgi:hypothetical protein